LQQEVNEAKGTFLLSQKKPFLVESIGLAERLRYKAGAFFVVEQRMFSGQTVGSLIRNEEGEDGRYSPPCPTVVGCCFPPR